MLLVYLCCLGARRQWWMPFWPPFLTAGKRLIKNTSSHRIKLIKQLFYQFIQNQAQALLPSPFQRGSLHWIGQMYTSHAVGVANGSPLWWGLLLSCAGGRRYFPYYSYHRKATEQEFFVSAQTLTWVILLIECLPWEGAICVIGASINIVVQQGVVQTVWLWQGTWYGLFFWGGHVMLWQVHQSPLGGVCSTLRMGPGNVVGTALPSWILGKLLCWEQRCDYTNSGPSRGQGTKHLCHGLPRNIGIQGLHK